MPIDKISKEIAKMSLLPAVKYRYYCIVWFLGCGIVLVWFSCGCVCGCCCRCGCDGSWKNGTAPPPPLLPPRAYGICPFHLLIACHRRYCGLCLSCSVIILIACDSPPS